MEEYPFYSRAYPMYNKENQYFETNQHKCLTIQNPKFKRMEKSNGKIIYDHSTTSNRLKNTKAYLSLT